MNPINSARVNLKVGQMSHDAIGPFADVTLFGVEFREACDHFGFGSPSQPDDGVVDQVFRIF